jgi:hypothetical protein
MLRNSAMGAGKDKWLLAASHDNAQADMFPAGVAFDWDSVNRHYVILRPLSSPQKMYARLADAS